MVKGSANEFQKSSELFNKKKKQQHIGRVIIWSLGTQLLNLD